MHDAHLEHAAAAALVEVVGDDVHGLARPEGVQVQLAGDGEDEGLPRVLVVRAQRAPPAAAAAK